jgi:thioredoxin reductase (NADPH)
MVKHIYPKGTKHKEIRHYDVLVLGAGPAGLTSALYAGRYNLSVAVIAKSIGGTTNLAGDLENWPGFFGPGTELMKKFKEQAEKFGARFLESEVSHVREDENGFVLEIGDKEIHGKALILALGTEHRKLNIPGEKEFLGRGVSYCATCDGNFFKNKKVVVVGGADSAAKAAVYLSSLAKQVSMVYRKNEMRCEPIILKQITSIKNIEVFYNSTPVKILGEKKVTALEIVQTQKDGAEKKIKIDTDGIFIEIGATPVGDIIRDLGISMDEGYIITDKQAKTNHRGVFAAGDSTNNHLKQVVTAAAEGAIAAKSAHDFLKYGYKN